MEIVVIGAWFVAVILIIYATFRKPKCKNCGKPMRDISWHGPYNTLERPEYVCTNVECERYYIE